MIHIRFKISSCLLMLGMGHFSLNGKCVPVELHASSGWCHGDTLGGPRRCRELVYTLAHSPDVAVRFAPTTPSCVRALGLQLTPDLTLTLTLKSARWLRPDSRPTHASAGAIQSLMRGAIRRHQAPSGTINPQESIRRHQAQSGAPAGATQSLAPTGHPFRAQRGQRCT